MTNMTMKIEILLPDDILCCYVAQMYILYMYIEIHLII
jgi:hypothetical protein